jgi:hypothetical protein
MSDRHLTENSTALVIGGEVKVVGLAVGGRLFVFSPVQMQFLLALQRMKNAAAAAMSVGKDEAWGDGFLRSRKFRDYISSKMEEFSVRNGLTVEWWYGFGKAMTDGFRESYRIHCLSCEYGGGMRAWEVENYRRDDMTLEVPCPVCYKLVTTELVKEDFQPTREQVVAWQELGARLIPKIERIHHQFDKSEIIFESEGHHE